MQSAQDVVVVEVQRPATIVPSVTVTGGKL